MKFCAWTIVVLYVVKLAAVPFLIGQPKCWSRRDLWIAVAFTPIFIAPAGRILGWW